MPPENLGARMVEEVTVDITSLTNAGNEPLSTWADESGLDVIDSAQVIGQEETAQLCLPDVPNDQVLVVDGTLSNVASGTDIGTVTLRLEGRT